jgi:predicted PurR-regulated permease PerM
MRSAPSRDRLAWWAVGGLLGVVLVGILVAFIGTFVTALFLYYVSRPVYHRLRTRVGRNLSAAGALLALAVPFVVLVAYTFAIALQEVQSLARTTDLGPLQAALEPYFDVSTVVEDPASILQDPDIVNAVRVVAENVFDFLPIILVGLLHLFIALAAAFYLLRDGNRLARWVRETFDNETEVLTGYGRIVDQDLSSVYFGNILNAAITAVIGAITYNVLNVFAPASIAIPSPALLGLLAGVASLIPVVGMKLVYIPVAVLLFGRALVDGDPLWFPTTFFLVSLVIVDTIPDLVLRPYISGKNLHVGLVMIAYIIGPLLFGWYGLFLGPLLLVLFVHFGRVVLPELLDGASGHSKNTPRGRATPASAGVPNTDPTATDHTPTADQTSATPSEGGDDTDEETHDSSGDSDQGSR